MSFKQLSDIDCLMDNASSFHDGKAMISYKKFAILYDALDTMSWFR